MPLSPAVHQAVGVWGKRSCFRNTLGRTKLGWGRGGTGGLLTPSQVLVFLRKDVGLEARPCCCQAAQRWGVYAGAPGARQSQWSPKAPACPQGRGNSSVRDASREPSGHQLLLSLQMVSKLPLMKTICNLHLDKLEFFRLLHPETAMNFPPLYKEVFNSELQYSDPRES